MLLHQLRSIDRSLAFFGKSTACSLTPREVRLLVPAFDPHTLCLFVDPAVQHLVYPGTENTVGARSRVSICRRIRRPRAEAGKGRATLDRRIIDVVSLSKLCLLVLR